MRMYLYEIYGLVDRMDASEIDEDNLLCTWYLYSDEIV